MLNNNQTKATQKTLAFTLFLLPYPILTSLPKRQLISFLPSHGGFGFIEESYSLGNVSNVTIGVDYVNQKIKL